MSRSAKLQFYLTIFAVILLLVSVTAGTFAWFTFRPDVDVTPLRGNVGETDGSLLISTDKNGPYDKTCTLRANVPGNGLMPVSTADLGSFYTAAAQNSNGEITAFRAAAGGVSAITGTVYLKATKKSCDVYFKRDSLNFGTDAQALAALRLGLRVSMPGKAPVNLIFQLDDLGYSGSAAAHSTLPGGYDGRVAAGSTLGSMAADPARGLAGYWATKVSDDPLTFAVDGKKPLFRIEVEGTEAIAQVDYFVYLEGCDVHCHNLPGGVTERNLALSLGFYGDMAPTGRS